MKNTIKILPVAILIICISAFIIADILIDPASFTVDEDTVYAYSIGINNTIGLDEDSNITAVNITLPTDFVFANNTNITSLYATFTNTSNVLSWVNASGLINGSYNATFTFNASMAMPGIYNFTITTLSLSNVINSSNLTVTITDTTDPNITSMNSPLPWGNYSGQLVLNVSITEDTPSLVYFNLTNSSGSDFVNFYLNTTASRIGTSTSYNFTLNTSLFADGVYNVTAYVNDSVDQVAWNGTTTFRIDNTNPTATYFYCTPSAPSVGDTVTCTCSGSADTGGSGVLSTTFTENPSTTTAGLKTETCTILDRAGNSIAPTTTFTVSASNDGSAAPSSGGTATTTQTWSNTYTASVDQFNSGYTKSISANERVRVRVGIKDHHVGLKSITTTTATIEIASDPVIVELEIGEDVKADVDDDEIYDIYVLLNNIVDGKADITITKIVEGVPEGGEPVTTTGEITTPGVAPEDSGRSYTWLWIVGILVILIGAGYKFKDKFM